MTERANQTHAFSVVEQVAVDPQNYPKEAVEAAFRIANSFVGRLIEKGVELQTVETTSMAHMSDSLGQDLSRRAEAKVA